MIGSGQQWTRRQKACTILRVITHRPRRDGFVGQHLIVLPEPVRTAARRHPLLRGLYVTDAGYFPSAIDHLVERTQGATTTLVILCMRGVGWVRAGEVTHPMHAGEFAWLPAREPHAYGAANDEPWSIAWAHFAGEEVPAWRAFFRAVTETEDAVISLPVDRLDEIALDQVYPALERGYALRHQVSAAAALRRALSAAAELAMERHDVRSARDRVSASIETLRRDWVRPHRLEELATAAGLSVTHYSALFRRHTGFAPIDFLIRLRVQQACRLLDTTKLSVAEIAGRVGYQDPYYFTRCFRRVMGCAPRNYRRVQKG
jgi:AraC family transcriptional regulator of arabinose operon